jgi:glucose/arabinose dehydrogenase
MKGKLAVSLLCASGLLQVAKAQLSLQVQTTGLTRNVSVAQDPTDPAVQYVVQKDGAVRVLKNGAIVGTFLDITPLVQSADERGLLGLALAPDYIVSGHVYIHYSTRTDYTQIVRFTRSAANPYQIDLSSRLDIFSEWNSSRIHRGGTLRFGPDGMLYIGLGDAGNWINAQRPETPFGKMLRIDVSRDDFPLDPARNYGIPLTNPFPAGNPLGARPEIWAFGYRNPWKFSFDDPASGGSGGMLVADVGQDAWEEVDYEPPLAAGRNYGWNVWEGNHATGQTTLAYEPVTFPTFEYNHTVGRSITGGYVYRGWLLGTAYRGRYFYADYILKKIFSVRLDIDPVTHEASAADPWEHTQELGGSASLGFIASVDPDLQGEPVLCDISGRLLRITRAPAAINPFSYAVARGVYRAGSLRSLATSDDESLIFRPGPVLSINEAPIQVILHGQAPEATAAVLRLVLETGASEANLTQKVEFYNFVSGQYDTVDTRQATRTDSSIALTVTDATKYLDPSDRKFRTRLSWKPSGPVLAYPWSARIDRAVWEYVP